MNRERALQWWNNAFLFRSRLEDVQEGEITSDLAGVQASDSAVPELLKEGPSSMKGCDPIDTTEAVHKTQNRAVQEALLVRARLDLRKAQANVLA